MELHESIGAPLHESGGQLPKETTAVDDKATRSNSTATTSSNLVTTAPLKRDSRVGSVGLANLDQLGNVEKAPKRHGVALRTFSRIAQVAGALALGVGVGFLLFSNHIGWGMPDLLVGGAVVGAGGLIGSTYMDKNMLVAGGKSNKAAWIEAALKNATISLSFVACGTALPLVMAHAGIGIAGHAAQSMTSSHFGQLISAKLADGLAGGLGGLGAVVTIGNVFRNRQQRLAQLDRVQLKQTTGEFFAEQAGTLSLSAMKRKIGWQPHPELSKMGLQNDGRKYCYANSGLVALASRDDLTEVLESDTKEKYNQLLQD